MGKVQDTISKISQRRQPLSAAEIALIIPSQQKPSSHSFPTNYQAASDWISAQTTNSNKTAVAALIKGLQHSNRLTNSSVERLKIMDLFAAEIQRTLPQLNIQYLGMDLPYPLSAQFAFEQAITLLTELSYGYKVALVDVLLGRSRLNQKSRVHAIYHSMKAIAECGFRHSQSYTPWPDKSWRDINTLLVLAEHENALHFPHEGATDNKKAPATILRLYTTMAAFAVSRTEQFKPHQMDALISVLNNNMEPFQLLTEKPQGTATIVYSVALNSAFPPAPDSFSQYAPKHKVRYFTIDPIYNPSDDNRDSEQNSVDDPTRTHLNKLNHIWAQSSPRQNARSIRHAPFYTQRGLTDIAAAVTALSDANTVENPFSTAWIMVNESANGIGLLATDHGYCSACVGDLIGWQTHHTTRGDTSCEVGIVRWLRCDSTDVLRIGVEAVGQSVRTASISKAVNLPSTVDSPTEALLCRDSSCTDAPALLLLPVNSFRLGETINISMGRSKRVSQMKLSEKIDQGANFDCFSIGQVTVSDDSVQSSSMLT